MRVCMQVRSSGRRVPAGTKPRLLPVAHTGRTNFSETDLLFYTQSPDYCHPEPLLGSTGTANRYDTGNGSVPIQLAQCRFPELAISNAKILIYFSNKIYGSNFIKQHSETVMVWNLQSADCSFSLKKFCVISIIFGPLLFHINWQKERRRRVISDIDP